MTSSRSTLSAAARFARSSLGFAATRALLPVALVVGSLVSGCDPGAESGEVDGDEAALTGACGLGGVHATLLTPEFTSSIPQVMTRLRITGRNLGNKTCSTAGTVEIFQNGKLFNTEKLPARDFPAGFSTLNRGLDRYYAPPVSVRVCYGPSFTCLSKTINSPIGE